MFVLGHLGIGSKLAGPWATGLPRRWLLVGTLVPDLIDKPLYYGLALATGRRGAELGLISGTRTFGHTALLLLVITLAAVARKSQVFAALALGVASHLVLDNLGDHFNSVVSEPSTVVALLFPFLGWKFPIVPFQNATEHLGSIVSPYVFGGEIVGAAILGWDLWKDRHQSEIVAILRSQRSKLRKLKLKFPSRKRRR